MGLFGKIRNVAKYGVGNYNDFNAKCEWSKYNKEKDEYGYYLKDKNSFKSSNDSGWRSFSDEESNDEWGNW